MWRKLALLWQKKQLFKYVRTGNVQRIRALCHQGANLEWMDKKGNTPLILACMNPRLLNVAKTLIELGANINAHPPAFRYKTPLYHAASSGLENTVNLLISNGANYDSQAPLQVARLYGLTNIRRAIEDHICVFSGWMREIYGPAFLGVYAPQLLDLLPPRFFSRRVWVVILPTSSRNPAMPFRFELAVYANQQGARLEVVMALRNPNLEEPEAMHPNTSVMIVDNDNPTKKSLKLAPSIEGGRQQLKWFCDACKGIPQPMRPPVTVPSAPPFPEPVEEGPIHYAISGSTSGNVPLASVGGANSENGRSGQCVICMDAPCVAACVPCGHIAGCMACLTEIKSNEAVCPICRANIDQIMMVYPV